MAQPPAYVRAFSFTDYTSNYPSTPQPGVRLDAEYDAIIVTLNAIRTNLALIQRDDGRLANVSVGADQLDPTLTLGLRTVTSWATTTAYVVNDAVWTTGKLYRALVAHTSSSFATDLAAAKWVLVWDPSTLVQENVNAAIAAGTITVAVDTSTFAGLAANNAFSGNNTFAGTSIFSQGPSSRVSTATTAATYFEARTTDHGAGKPALRIRKKTTANAWEIKLDDDAAGSGALDIVVSAHASFTVNGAALPQTSDITTLQTSIRRARNLALAAR